MQYFVYVIQVNCYTSVIIVHVGVLYIRIHSNTYTPTYILIIYYYVYEGACGYIPRGRFFGPQAPVQGRC